MRLRMVVCGVAAILLASACATQSDGDDPGKEYTLASGTTRLSNAVMQYMDATAAASDQGLSLKYSTTSTATTSALLAGLLSGDYDFIVPGTQTAMAAVAKGAPVKIVASVANSPEVLLIRKDVAARLAVQREAAQEDRVQALQGLRIGTGPAGSATYDRVRAIARTVGMDPDRDITLLGVSDGSALASGLRTGVYDAIWVSVGDSESLIVDGTAEQWLSLPHGDFAEISDEALVVVATTSTIEQHPDVVDKLRAALRASAEGIRSDPDSAGRLMRDRWFSAMSQEAFDIAWSSGRLVAPADIDFTRDDFARSQRIVELSGDTSTPVDYDQLVAKPAQGQNE
jgi:NitT/TauT family transport system substrate-binding protein